jgi:hypothetical protein
MGWLVLTLIDLFIGKDVAPPLDFLQDASVGLAQFDATLVVSFALQDISPAEQNIINAKVACLTLIVVNDRKPASRCFSAVIIGGNHDGLELLWSEFRFSRD